jgi:hypothetical protein
VEDAAKDAVRFEEGLGGSSQPVHGECLMTTTKKTLARSWLRIYAIRHLPDDQFSAHLEIIEREAVDRHPSEEPAIRQILDAYAYRARKPEMDNLPNPLEI